MDIVALERAEVNTELASRYESAIQLLKIIQLEYRRAIKQLQEMSSHFGQREAMIGEQLRTGLHALDQVTARHYSEVSISPEQVLPQQLAQHSVPALEVYCLGRFQVRVGWKRIEHWPSTKAKSVLKYLIAQQRRPVSRDVLMEALWPGCEPSLANNNLKAAVRTLRQTLNAAQDTNGDFPWVLFQDGNYLINSEVDSWMDVEQFEYHWQAGRQLEREGKQAEAIRELQAAEALYKGDYLEDDLYEDWTWLRREALKDTYLAILGRLADDSMQKADYEGCVVYCQKILGKDPCREDAYRRLMCCYSRLGQRNRAIAWYRLCHKIIRAELDVDPDHATVALYQKLLKDEDT